jgi:hypothetical protein
MMQSRLFERLPLDISVVKRLKNKFDMISFRGECQKSWR